MPCSEKQSEIGWCTLGIMTFLRILAFLIKRMKERFIALLERIHFGQCTSTMGDFAIVDIGIINAWARGKESKRGIRDE